MVASQWQDTTNRERAKVHALWPSGSGQTKDQKMTVHVQRADGFVEPRTIHSVFISGTPSTPTR